MTSYTRTHNGHTMMVHAPRPGELDRAAFAAFTAVEPVLGLDVETRTVDDRGPRQFADRFTVRLVQFGSDRAAWVLNPVDPAQCAVIEATLADPARRFVTHTNYDPLAVWAVFGVPLGQRVADTHVLSKLASPDERAGHGLNELTARHLDDGLTAAQDALYARMRHLAPPGQRAGNSWQRWGWDHIPADDEAYAVYAGLDAVYVRRLLPVLLQRCAPFPHLARMESWLAAQATGITIRGLLDAPYTRGLLADLDVEHHRAEAVITAALGCPARSPRFAEWLDGVAAAAGIIGFARTPTGRLQVTAGNLATLVADDAAMAALPAGAADIVTARLAVSRASNLIANARGFLTTADAHGRVHPQVNTLRAKTARMSITGPALQTLKKHDPRLRRCFRADPGHVLISCDFSQVEIRVAAALADDPTLKQVIASGADIHDATAALMYGPGFTDEQRTISKRATFGTIYGGGARALAAQTGVSEDTARQVIQRWRRTYPRVIAYGQRLAALPEVATASGRRIPADPARPYANANYAVQSTARDLLLAAVYRLVTGHHIGGLWLFVHDEVIVQARERDADRVRDALKQAMAGVFRGVPIAADAKILGRSWGQLDGPPPAPPCQENGTSGTCGTSPVHTPASGFRAAAGVSEPAEPAPCPPANQTRKATAMTSSLLAAALACAERGWKVFPVQPRAKKPPAVTGWEDRATTDPDRIRRCWAHGPYNVAIACGPSGLVVIDLDVPKLGQTLPPRWAKPGITDGADVLADLCDTHGQPWPSETFTVRTGRGGTHLYFIAPPGAAVGNRAGDNGRGLGWLVDVRGTGGYVIAPGSVVDLPTTGPYGVIYDVHLPPIGPARYEVIHNVAPAPLPDWLTGLLTAAPQIPPLGCRPTDPEQVRDLDSYTATALKRETDRVRATVEGSRNHALNKAAYHLGQLIAAGALPDALACEELFVAASVHFGIGDPPFTPDAARATISAALAAGKRKPRQLTTREVAA